MRKIVVLGVSSFLFLTGNHAFAQFKQLARSAQNMKRLQSFTARGAADTLLKSNWRVKVPTHVVPTGEISVLPVRFPKQITPVTVVLIDKLFTNCSVSLTNSQAITTIGNHLARAKGLQFALGENPVGKAFYENQSELARDLDRFYEGKSEEKIGPDGHVVKFYPLPVDGILYKPVGYQVPVVLSPENYFVIYDVQTKTGQIADNTPQVYELFLTRIQYEQLQNAKAAAEEMAATQHADLAGKDPILAAAAYTYNQQVYANDRAAERWEEAWYAMGLPYQFRSQKELGQALKTFHYPMGTKIRRKGAQEISYIFEIPVKGLSYMDVHGDLVEINPDRDVFWYLSDNMGTIIKRSDFEEGNLFEYVE